MAGPYARPPEHAEQSVQISHEQNSKQKHTDFAEYFQNDKRPLRSVDQLPVEFVLRFVLVVPLQQIRDHLRCI